MRISDWSSDLCSSDLTIDANVEHGETRRLLDFHVRRALRFTQRRCDLLGRQVKPPALGRRQRAGHMGVGATMPDRKRGVEGKRVSGRVDRGGRRSIKKKCINTSNEVTQ